MNECQLNTRKAIIENIMGSTVNGFMFTRYNNDIKINAKSKQQEYAVALRLSEAINEKYISHDPKNPVSSVRQYTNGTFVELHPTNRLVDSIITEEKLKRETEEALELQEVEMERGDYTQEDLGEFYAPITVTPFEKFIQYKVSVIKQIKTRIHALEILRTSYKFGTDEHKAVSSTIYNLKNYLQGNDDLNIKGLEEELEDIKTNIDFDSLDFYFQRDVERVGNLSLSSNIDDILEAERIINFWKAAGNLEANNSNSIFSDDELFFPDMVTRKKDETTIQKLSEWVSTITYFQNLIEQNKRKNLVESINDDSAVQNTYNKNFNYEEVTSAEGGLRDANWLDMWTSDVSSGTFSKNGILPQVMLNQLERIKDEKLSWARELQEKLNKLSPLVSQELNRLGYTLRGLGIILKGTSYDLYMQKTADGKNTGLLIDKFSPEYYQKYKAMESMYYGKLKMANENNIDPDTKRRLYDDAKNERKNWIQNNNIIFDITKLKDVLNHPDLAHYNGRIVDDGDVHKNELIALLGQSTYDDYIAKQVESIKTYDLEYDNFVNSFMASNKVTDISQLTDTQKFYIEGYEKDRSPFYGVVDYNGVNLHGTRARYNTFANNVLIPKKENTGYYDKNFEVIENNPILKEFYTLAKESFEIIRNNMPLDLQEGLNRNTIPVLKKGITDILTDPNLNFWKKISKSTREVMQSIKDMFSIIEESEISYANRDIITGKDNYELDTSFMRTNRRNIQRQFMIDSLQFRNIANLGLGAINKYTSIGYDLLNAEAIAYVESYTGYKIDTLKQMHPVTLPIGQIIYDSVVHNIVQENSLDLPKLLRYYSNVTMDYAARKEALPIMDLMKQYYQQIKQPETTNTDKEKIGFVTEKIVQEKLRSKAITQMDNWFDRVVLGKFGGKEFGVFDNWKNYSEEDKRIKKELEELIKEEQNPEIRKQLENELTKLGRSYALSAMIENGALKYAIYKNLGYNASSGITNFIEGTQSNMILAASGEHFTPANIYRAYNINHKTIMGGKKWSGDSKKTSILMERYSVLQDSSNELQKSSNKSNFSWVRKLAPYEITRRVEYINQSPLMNSILFDIMITGKDGTQENVFDAMDDSGKLLDNFATDENVQSWEKAKGDRFSEFKSKLTKTIVIGHGNYDKHRGMMAKSNIPGKAIMMFKTWITTQLYQRFAIEHDDISTGRTNVKGRYGSLTPGQAAIVGTVAGVMTGGLLFGAGLGGVALIVARVLNKNSSSPLMEMQKALDLVFQSIKHTIGMPLNTMTGREILSVKDYKNLSKREEANTKANIADLALMLTWLGLTLMTKALFYDDDDEDKEKKKIHNILANRFLQLGNQGASYLYPTTLYDNVVGEVGLIKWCGEVGKTLQSVGEGEYTTGVYAGENKFMHNVKKTFVPSIFRDPLSFGFQNQTKQQFIKTPFFDKWFSSDEKKIDNQKKQDKASFKRELINNGTPEDEAAEIANKTFSRKGSRKEKKEYKEKLKDEGYNDAEISDAMRERYKKKEKSKK